MARLHLPGAANLTVIRRPEANPVAIGHDLRWWAAWVAVTLTEPIEEAHRTILLAKWIVAKSVLEAIPPPETHTRADRVLFSARL